MLTKVIRLPDRSRIRAPNRLRADYGFNEFSIDSTNSMTWTYNVKHTYSDYGCKIDISYELPDNDETGWGGTDFKPGIPNHEFDE